MLDNDSLQQTSPPTGDVVASEGHCRYCGAARVNRPDFHWQFDCKNSSNCIVLFDKEASEFLRKKYEISVSPESAGAE